MTETEEQAEIVRWYRETYPEHAMSLRISTSGLNYGSGKRGAILAKHVRSQGVVEGESDITILLGRGRFSCMVLEHKSEEGRHKITEAQQAYLDYHERIGNCAVATKGIEAAKAAIKTYMEQTPNLPWRSDLDY